MRPDVRRDQSQARAPVDTDLLICENEHRFLRHTGVPQRVLQLLSDLLQACLVRSVHHKHQPMNLHTEKEDALPAGWAR
jgi:hypothetical protein